MPSQDTPLARFLGIDPGSRICGFSVVEVPLAERHIPQRYRVIELGVIKPNAKLSFSERVGELHNTIYELISTYQPQHCVIEDAFFGENASSALKLGQVRGALISAAYRHDVQIESITPAQVKKLITGNGKAGKEEVKASMSALLRIKLDKFPLDATDALAIAVAHGVTSESTHKSTWRKIDVGTFKAHL